MNKKICECGAEYDSQEGTCLGLHYEFNACPECRRKHYAQVAKQDEALRLAEVAKVRRVWRYERTSIPPKFMNEDFSSFQTKREGNVKAVYEKCVAYAAGYPLIYREYVRRERKPYPSFMLISPAGLGKTHLACSIGHRVLDRWGGEDITCPVLFVSEPVLHRGIRETYRFSREEQHYRESEEDILKRLIHIPLLILDDIGKEERDNPKFVQRTLFCLIDGRYRNMLPTVLTTNLTLDELTIYLGSREEEPTFSRLVEMCKGHVWTIHGKSFRGEK